MQQEQPVQMTQTVETKSLLDQIVEQQALTASRYMPVMTPAQAIMRRDAIAQLKQLVLVEGVDYGVIPGTDKPTLYKPGAEKICAFFGYVPSIEVVAEIEDWAGERFGEPLFYYRYRVTLLKDSAAVGQGEGSCNSWETKYRYRNANRKCPACGKECIIKGKDEYGGGWVCFGKKGGCGAKYPDGSQQIEGQAVGRVANPDFADVINTIQKMGQKRAYIAATLSATGASQWFTQDVEDMPTIEDVQRQAANVNTGGAAMGTKEAADAVAKRKVAEATAIADQQRAADAERRRAAEAQPTNPNKLPVDFKVIQQRFAEMEGIIGKERYDAVLVQIGGPACKQANQLGDLKKYQAAYDAMVAIAKSGEAVPA